MHKLILLLVPTFLFFSSVTGFYTNVYQCTFAQQNSSQNHITGFCDRKSICNNWSQCLSMIVVEQPNVASLVNQTNYFCLTDIADYTTIGLSHDDKDMASAEISAYLNISVCDLSFRTPHDDPTRTDGTCVTKSACGTSLGACVTQMQNVYNSSKGSAPISICLSN